MHADKDRKTYVDLFLQHNASVQAVSEEAPTAIQTVILRGWKTGCYESMTQEDLYFINLFIKQEKSFLFIYKNLF